MSAGVHGQPPVQCHHRCCGGAGAAIPGCSWCCRALAQDNALQGVPISVDTFSAAVAREAVAAGAHLVNDVSGGSLDPDMHATVS